MYGEHYATARMKHAITKNEGRINASYEWHWLGRASSIAIETRNQPVLPEEGSADAFIFEHYWGDGRSTYRVEHAPWRTYSVTGAHYDIDGDFAYGVGFESSTGKASSIGDVGRGVGAQRVPAAMKMLRLFPLLRDLNIGAKILPLRQRDGPA